MIISPQLLLAGKDAELECRTWPRANLKLEIGAEFVYAIEPVITYKKDLGRFVWKCKEATREY